MATAGERPVRLRITPSARPQTAAAGFYAMAVNDRGVARELARHIARGPCESDQSWDRSSWLGRLDRLSEGQAQAIMLKLTLPEVDNFYAEVVNHPRALRVVALSGGYSREESNARLSRQNGMVASFSRALTEGLTAQLSDDEFDAALDVSVGSIFAASKS